MSWWATALTGQNLGGPQQTKVPGCTSNHAFISDEKLFLFMLGVLLKKLC